MFRSASRHKSERAGLKFPISRVARQLKQLKLSHKLGVSAPIFLAAVLEYLCAEMLELAGDAARDQGRSRITPRHIQLAVRNDEELNYLLSKITIPGGGVNPSIHNVLLPKKSKTYQLDKA